MSDPRHNGGRLSARRADIRRPHGTYVSEAMCSNGRRLDRPSRQSDRTSAVRDALTITRDSELANYVAAKTTTLCNLSFLC